MKKPDYKNTFLATAAVLLTVMLVGCNGSQNDEAGAAASSDATEIGKEAAREEGTTSWREDYAYSMGTAAMHYAYPYLRMAHVRWDWTIKTPAHPEVVPNNALNTFWHASKLTNADWREGGTPNNDTLYSVAWLHVADEPLIISLPLIDRFYTFELSGMNSDNFAYISELEHGRKAGNYALLPRGWKGELPDGVFAVAEVPSPWIMVGGRTYVGGENDIPVVRELQQQYKITPLGQWGQNDIEIARPEVFKPYDTELDPLAIWKTINHALTENPPIGGETMLMRFFTEINIGPDLDVDALDDESKRGLARAAVDGLDQIKQAQLNGAGSSVTYNNGWVYNNALGRAGTNGDFLNRTVHQSYSGIVANDPAEAIYYGGFVGSDKQPLNGSKKYQIKIPAGGEPEVNAFWSITMYGTDGNFVANEIQRYSIGDRTAGLRRDADGGLTIALQAEMPSDEAVNWLPAPAGTFYLVLRAYQPGQSVLDGSFALPPVILLD
jgi:hypothetical protein